MRNHIRYYDKFGNYLDHGRMIYKSVPEVGDMIHPFITIHGYCNWKIVEVKALPNDSCYEIYVEDFTDQNIGLKTSMQPADTKITD